MLTKDDSAYHRERARDEMDLAYRAERQAVAQAHMRLAALHMSRLKLEDEYCDGSSVRSSIA